MEVLNKEVMFLDSIKYDSVGCYFWTSTKDDSVREVGDDVVASCITSAFCTMEGSQT